MNIILTNEHINPQYLYVVYDADGASSCPVFGVFTSRRKALEAIDEIVLRCVNDMLAENPEETGLTEEDRYELIKDTKSSFAIQVLHNGIDTIHYSCDIESPLV